MCYPCETNSVVTGLLLNALFYVFYLLCFWTAETTNNAMEIVTQAIDNREANFSR